MKKHIFGIATLSTIFALSVGLVVVTSSPYKEADASSYTVNSVPTTIDLNDTSESNIRSYYSSLNNLPENERKGTNLLKNLKPILKNDQKYFSYGGSATKAVWQAYEIVDRDWNKSPASSISGYNAQTNKITGYVYGTGNDSVGSNPYIHALYVNRNVENQQRAWGNHNQVQWGINQEHIWAKSCGFENESPAAGARGDLMHLWAANGRVNGDTHSNYYYGYVDKTRSYNNAGDYASTLSGNLRGYSKTLGGTVTVFEPQNSDKGDIARAIFYMAARYNYLSGSDSDGIDAGNPNLEIVNNITSWSNSGYQSTVSTTGKMGILQDLLEWNRLDPPDEFEIHRNNLCYNNFTKNRNPFIDFPSWANAIWGTVDSNGNYNSTPSSFASPSSDTIGSSTGDPVFGISNTQLNLEVGDTATISGRNAETAINWTVGNSSVVSLDKTTTANNVDVTVTALAAGTTTITATSGNDSATCTVTVSEYTKVAAYDFSVGNTSSSPAYTDEGLLDRFHNSSDDNLTDIVIDVNDTNRVYPAYNSSYLDYGIKLGGSSAPGSFIVSLNTNVAKVVVNAAGWGTGDNLAVGDADAQTPGVAYDENNPFKTLTYNITSTNEVEFTFTNRGFIRSIEFYISGSPIVVEDVPQNHLTSVTRIAGLYGDATTTQTTGPVTNAVNVSTLGIESGADVSDVELGHSMTLDGAKGTGSNPPRYYSSDGTIRVYNGNSITFESANAMTNISFTVTNGSGDNLNVSTGTISGSVWTGEATSVTFTNTASTQFRFTNVSITYTASTSSISVTGMSFKFGITISQEDWDAIADKWEISDYGVMIVKENTLQNVYHENTVKDAHTAGKKLQDLHKGNGDTPYAYESNYLFTVKLNIGANIAHNLRFVASPYIVIDDVYYFLGEIRCSINELAATCLTTGETNLPDDALTYLTTH